MPYVEASAIDDFIEARRLNHQGSAAESGNRRFDVPQDPTDPGHFVSMKPTPARRTPGRTRRPRTTWRGATRVAA